MYKIFADSTLIYDSTLGDYKIGKGAISLETNKSGSFTFSVYPDHFFYDKFVRLKTVITVYKSGKIIFRGRILNDVTDYWNNKSITCEGELGFLQDSIVRPFTFSGTPENLFKQFINEHNSQVDEFKRFKIGKITVVDPNDYIVRSNEGYESTMTNVNKRLAESTLGGYLYITHGEDGTEEIPTLNYLANFDKVSSQTIEFGSNLKNYTKTVKAESIATVIIPLGSEVSEGEKLTIESVNDGKDYVQNDEAVALYGRIVKVVNWDDVTLASNLKRKAEKYLEESINQSITIELNAIDLHLVDHSIESFKIGDYIRVVSAPHNFDAVMLCNKQSLDLLKPENDSLTLGYTYTTFTETSSKVSSSVSSIPVIQATVNKISNRVIELDKAVEDTEQTAENALNNYQNVNAELGQVTGDLEAIAGVVTENARNIATNATNISNNAKAIADHEVEFQTLRDTNTPTEILVINEEIVEGGFTEVQTGDCDISEYNRLKVFFKNISGHLFETEIFTDGNTTVATYLNAHAGTEFQSSELTFTENTFTLALSVVHSITSEVSFTDKETRCLSIYRIEGYKFIKDDEVNDDENGGEEVGDKETGDGEEVDGEETGDGGIE